MNWALKDKSRSYVFFFWIGFFIVLFMNILVWLYLNQVEAHFRNNLRNRLQDSNHILGRLVSRYNQDVNLETLLPGDRSSTRRHGRRSAEVWAHATREARRYPTRAVAHPLFCR